MELYELTAILGSIAGFCIGIMFKQELFIFQNKRKSKEKSPSELKKK